MKRIELGQAISIVANIGVIAGIVFLGIELRQNNELMAAQARQASFENNRQFAENLFENPNLAEILAKVETGEETSPAEDIQLYGVGLYTLRSFEFAYRELGELDVPALINLLREQSELSSGRYVGDSETPVGSGGCGIRGRERY